MILPFVDTPVIDDSSGDSSEDEDEEPTSQDFNEVSLYQRTTFRQKDYLCRQHQI
jgi:hypothetical protein